MGRVVYGPLANITTGSAGDEDVWGVVAGASTPIKLLAFELTSSATTATLVTLILKRISANGTGTAVAEVQADEGLGSITASMITDAATPGTDTADIMGFQWEQLGPLTHVFTPEMAPLADVTDGFALNLVTATAITVSGYVCWEEIGA